MKEITEKMDRQLGSQLRGTQLLHNQLWIQLHSQLYIELYSQLNSQFLRQLHNQLDEQLKTIKA
jgi:hypothetical protein